MRRGRRADPAAPRGASRASRRPAGWSWASRTSPRAAKGDGLHAAAGRGSGAGARSCSRREGGGFDDFRLCLHHPSGLVPELSRSVRLPQARARDAARRGPRSGHRSGPLVDDRRHRRRRPGGQGSRLPDGAVEHDRQPPQAERRPRLPTPSRRTCGAAARLLLLGDGAEYIDGRDRRPSRSRSSRTAPISTGSSRWRPIDGSPASRRTRR